MEYRELSKQEEFILRILWNNQGIANKDLLALLEDKYNVEYARTTLVTFIDRMIKKGYAKREHAGRDSYIYYLVDKKTYLQTIVDYWDGDLVVSNNYLKYKKEIFKCD